MRIDSSAVISVSSALAGAALIVLFGFGPLDPPNGPITPTYKTLTEVEPRTAINADNTPGDANSTYRISTPGSYYLANSFSVLSGKSGIEVATANVTIDLNGFRIAGTNGSLDGIALGSTAGVTIRNGVIFGLSGNGIDGVSASAGRIEGVTVRGNAGQGIAVGAAWEILHCIADNNGSHGINTGDTCTVTDCIARGNTGVGIDVDDNSTVSGCTSSENEGAGFGANVATTIANCSSSGNAAEGFYAHDFCILRDCVARGNGAAGFALYQQPNATRCTALNNTGPGFDLTFGGTVEGCNASFNMLHGIRVRGNGGSNAVYLLNNVCSSNANSHGIYVHEASGVRIEGNQCSFNDDRGIYITSAGNFIVKNTCRGNGAIDFTISGGNHYGQVIHEPGSAFDEPNSWANFAY